MKYLFLIFISFFAIAEEVAQVHSQQIVTIENKEYLATIIHPCRWENNLPLEVSGGPKENREAFFLKNKNKTQILLQWIHAFALKRYTDLGYLDEDTEGVLKADVATILTNQDTIVLITNKNFEGPEDIYLMLRYSSATENGIALEKTLQNFNIPPLEKPEIKRGLIPDLSYLREGPTKNRYVKKIKHGPFYTEWLGRYFVLGGYGELKNLIRSDNCPDDFILLITQIISRYTRWSNLPVPEQFKISKIPDGKIAQRYYYAEEQINFLKTQGGGLPDYLIPGLQAGHNELELFLQPVLANSFLFIEAFGDFLPTYYQKKMKFPEPIHILSTPFQNRKIRSVSVFRVPLFDFEHKTWEALKKSPGYGVVKKGYLQPSCFEILTRPEYEAQKYMNEKIIPNLMPLIHKAEYDYIMENYGSVQKYVDLYLSRTQ
jgi:hypothetical protein